MQLCFMQVEKQPSWAQPDTLRMVPQVNTFMHHTNYYWSQSDEDAYLYTTMAKDGCFIMVILHVDDVLIGSPNKGEIWDFKDLAKSGFCYKALDSKHIFGIQIMRDIRTF